MLKVSPGVPVPESSTDKNLVLKVSPGVPVPECFIFGTSALAFSATACLVSWLPGYLCAPAFSS